MTLQQIWDWLPEKTDKGNVHSYLPVYEEILSPYRAGNILEIGLFNGASMKMWERYFTGSVYGIDSDEQPHGGMADLRPMIAEGTHNIFIMDATDPAKVQEAFGGIKFDVIIEDAAHYLAQQLLIYKTLKPYLADGGLYVIEDIQDIDQERKSFENMDAEKEITVIDRRNVKDRYDDCLVIIAPKKLQAAY